MTTKRKYKYSAIFIASMLLMSLILINISFIIVLKANFICLLAINGMYILTVFLVVQGFKSKLILLCMLLLISGLSCLIALSLLSS